MRKYLQITLVSVAFLGLVMGKAVFKSDGEEGQVMAPVISPTSIPDTPTEVPTISGQTPPTKAISTPTPAGKFKSGSYMGSVEDAFYGNIQVKAVITSGKLTDVIFLQYPNDNRTSISINTQASVYLKEEALIAQSANVNIVTGASDSSMAFQKSLSSALRQAQL